MQQPNSYRYPPLERNNENIRLLQILESDEQGRDVDLIRCSIETASLDQGLEYIALSYTWGDAKVTKPIFIDGEELQVTTNLHLALVALQARGINTRLWIDAICINQQDNDEKSWQVGQMLRIYEEATQVLVWLGPSADNSDAVFDIIKEIGRDALNCGILSFTEEQKEEAEALFGQVQHLSAFRYHLPQGKPGTFENMLFQHFAGPDRPNNGIICPPAPLEALMSRSWWQRIWVLQEFSVAREVLFMCGDRAVSGEVFEAGLMFFKMQTSSRAQSDSIIHTMDSLDIGIRYGSSDSEEDKENERKKLEANARVLYDLDQHHTTFFIHRRRYQAKNRMNLLRLLLDVSGSAHSTALCSTDPRDIIFGLLGLSTDAKALGIVPNYTLSVLQVYEQVAVALNRNLYDILPLCLGTDLEAAKRAEWPSWVPDWRKTELYSKFNPLVGFQAGDGLQALWIYDERQLGRLGVNCRVIDKVVEVEPLPLSSGQDFQINNASNLIPRQFQSSILQAAKFVEKRMDQLQAVKNDTDAVWRTLIADQLLLERPQGPASLRLGTEHAALVVKLRDIYNAIANQDLFRFFGEEISELTQQCFNLANDNDDAPQPTDSRINMNQGIRPWGLRPEENYINVSRKAYLGKALCLYSW